MNLSQLKQGDLVEITSIKINKARPDKETGIVKTIGRDFSVKDRMGNNPEFLVIEQNRKGRGKPFELKFWSHNIENIISL